MSFTRLFTKSRVTPLGRWGVCPDKAIDLMESTKIYDSSFSPYINTKDVKQCIYYCKSCFQLSNTTQVIKYKNAFALKDNLYCKNHNKD